MEKARLKYHATNNCIKEIAEKYTDEDAKMDLEAICKKKSKRTFLMIEKNSSQQNPITTFRLEKHHDKFFGIKYISPFKVLFTQVQICLHASVNVLPNLFSKNIDSVLQGSSPFKMVNDIWSTQYIGYKISCLTLMMMALECFVNENIPSEIDKGTDDKGQNINKEYIERHWNLKLKMQEIRDWYKITDKRYATLIAEIIPLQQLRNEFVHLKSDKPNSFDDHCIECYDKLLSMDLQAAFDKIKEYIKIVKPDIVLD